MVGFGRYYELDVDCRGEPDETTGYLLNIKVIDEAVRTYAIPMIEEVCRDRPHSDPSATLFPLITALSPHLPGLRQLRLHLSPTWSIAMQTDTQDTVILRQQFEFAASHRLHAPQLTDDENRAFFGKCNNPAGHGHNYRFEPSVRVPVDRSGKGPVLTAAALEEIVDARVIQWLDHRHLNTDVPEFDPDRGGVIPSVEHIARLCFERLRGSLDGTPGVELLSVRVWETDRTSCEYPAR